MDCIQGMPSSRNTHSDIPTEGLAMKSTRRVQLIPALLSGAVLPRPFFLPAEGPGESSRARRVLASALLCAATAFGIPAHAASFTLAWNPSSSANVAGYVIYYGTSSGTYTGKVDAGLASQYTVGNLSAGAKYYVAMASYDAVREESTKSAEIAVTTLAAATPAPTPTAAPTTTPSPTVAPSPTPTAVPTATPITIPGGVVVTPAPTANPTPTRGPRGTPTPTVAPTVAPTTAPTGAAASPTPAPATAGGSVTSSTPSSSSGLGGCAYRPGSDVDPVLPMTLFLAMTWVGLSRRRRLDDARGLKCWASPFGDSQKSH